MEGGFNMSPDKRKRALPGSSGIRTRIGIVVVALAATAYPAYALAASSSGGGPVAAGARSVVAPPLKRPAQRLKQSIDVQVHRFRVELRRQAAEHRQQAAERRRRLYANLPGGVSIDTLNAIAACESGGDPTIVSSDGSYRGKYQFDYGTWASVGGSGDPAAAPEAEQDYRAALLYARSGSSPWPVCGQ
jgi:hypothetical protein